MCNVNRATCSEKSTENYYPTHNPPQLYRAFQQCSVHCFVFRAGNFTVLVHSHQPCCQQQQAAVFRGEKSYDKPTVHYLSNA